jgi:hypothetical protein
MNHEEFIKEQKKLIALDKLKLLLRKLGLRSIKSVWGDSVLTPAEVAMAVNRVQSDFGKPDVVIMDSASFDALEKHLGHK